MPQIIQYTNKYPVMSYQGGYKCLKVNQLRDRFHEAVYAVPYFVMSRNLKSSEKKQ